MPKHIPIFVYPGGNPVDPSTLSPDTTYTWVEPLGGGTVDGPLHYGANRPDGKPAHGGVLTYDANGNPIVAYHLYIPEEHRRPPNDYY